MYSDTILTDSQSVRRAIICLMTFLHGDLAMARTIKAPDERRSELIATAQELFYTKGYESTSVSDIVKTVGVAQGTFYYYFDSKSAILEDMIDEMVAQMVVQFQAIIADETLSAIPKWQKAMQVTNNWKIERKAELIEVGRTLFKEDNILLRHKLHKEVLKVTACEMVTIIQQGVEEGTFNTEFIPETAEIVMTIIASLGETMNELMFNPQEYDNPIPLVLRKQATVQTAVEHLLGAPPGSMPIIDEATITAWFTS